MISSLKVYLLYMCMSVFACYVCAPHAWSAQKRAWDLLELELQMVVSRHMYAGSFVRMRRAFNC